MEKTIKAIANEMDSLASTIFLNMIPEYKEGYLNYVFQTDKEDIQKRRIKNLAKNFRRLEGNPYFYVMPMSQHSALDIIENWKFQKPFNLYNVADNLKLEEQIKNEDQREGKYFQVIRNGALFGWTSLEKNKNHVKVKLQMKTSEMGKGLGKDFIKTIEDFVVSEFDVLELFVSIFSFDEKAIHLFKDLGYTEKSTTEKIISGKSYHLVEMKKAIES